MGLGLAWRRAWQLYDFDVKFIAHSFLRSEKFKKLALDEKHPTEYWEKDS